MSKQGETIHKQLEEIQLKKNLQGQDALNMIFQQMLKYNKLILDRLQVFQPLKKMKYLLEKP